MCLLLMVSRVVDGSPLVVGANRDERLERPAKAITVLRPSTPRILGGRDELAGGTWLAVNEHGVVAALTNRPGPRGRDPTKRSRGELPMALTEHRDAATAAEELLKRFKPMEYNPCWVLVGDRTSLYSIDMTGDERADAEALPAGTYVLENLPLRQRSFKVDHVRELLGPVASDDPQAVECTKQMKAVLSDHSLPYEVENSHEGAQDEGRRTETYSACVHSDDYGTRSSTIVVIGADARSAAHVEVSDGPPCSSDFKPCDSLWRSGV